MSLLFRLIEHQTNFVLNSFTFFVSYDIFQDVEKLRRFLLWGTSTALKSDIKKKSRPSESHQDAKTLAEEPQEETTVAKFLRWLLASVILGKLYSEDNDSDPSVLSKTKPETLWTLLEYFKTRDLKGSETRSEHIIGEVIVHLQQLLCTNYGVLPSVVCALSLMLLRSDLGIAGMLLFTDLHNSCSTDYLVLNGNEL